MSKAQLDPFYLLQTQLSTSNCVMVVGWLGSGYGCTSENVNKSGNKGRESHRRISSCVTFYCHTY